MKRRNFFAFVPSLFAVPLMAKEIIQEKDKVTIIKPEPIHLQKPSLTTFDMSRCRVQLVYDDGQIIGEGYLTQINVENPLIEVSSRYEQNGAKQYLPGPKSVDISAQLYNFHL